MAILCLDNIIRNNCPGVFLSIYHFCGYHYNCCFPVVASAAVNAL